ncbi:MAG: UvrD-helicase domain-containing protein, partial [Gammaproteobacteria bacterium]
MQAPAGSGKTELLTQRYLRLLACVDAPEEIIAITFTRKAAGEMRARIVEALERAADDTPPEHEHKRETWMLARTVRAHDVKMEWNLTAHPARLRIQTIDSLNAELTRQMPLLSKFGAQPGIAERPEALYEEAAQRTLGLLESREARLADAVSTLLRHLDNDLPRVRGLLAQMLPQRDQWLRHTGSGQAGGQRIGLEAAFTREISQQLRALHAAIPHRFHTEIAALARHAAQTLAAQGKESPLRSCYNLTDLPEDSVTALPTWKGVTELFLTAGNAWRKRVDATFGFAAGSGEKTRMQEVLMQFSENESLREQFVRVRRLPQPQLDDAQWQMLEALLTLLPLTVAQLQLAFAERSQVDYAEVAVRALAALGAAERPTDLALAL